jgi:thiosulfate/3-mercaptopyruvate sulfurtransferase
MKKLVLILLALAMIAPAFARDVDAIVSAEWLGQNLNNQRLVVLDIRAVPAYREAHVPGAVSSVAASWYPKKGDLNAELPEADVLVDLIREAGIDQNSIVVVVNAEGGAQYHVSARVAFTLKYAGIENVGILDGGFKAWTAAGQGVATGFENKDETEYELKPRPQYLVSQDYVIKNMKRSQLLDARSYDSYFGRVKFANATQYGHIPGAYAAPKEWLYDADGKLVPKAQIEELLKALKIDPKKEVIGYCDTGMGCSIWWWVLSEHLGWKNVKMYDGSSEELTKNPKVVYTKYVWR